MRGIQHHSGVSVSIRRVLGAGLALLLVAGLAAPVGAAGLAGRRAADADAFHGRFIVTWKTPPPAALGIAGVRATRATARPVRTIVQARTGSAADVAAQLRKDPRVLAVVPDAEFTFTAWPADGTPDDELYPDQTDLPQIGVPTAWQTTTGDPSVVVAVLDTGVDLTHPDLDDVAVSSPEDVFWNTSDVTDHNGHGTHTAGTIIAEANNARGIAGIAPDRP